MNIYEVNDLKPGYETNALVGTFLGYQAWIETRGDTLYFTWQAPGARDPWMGSQDSEKRRAHYVACRWDDLDPYKHCADKTLPNFSGDEIAALKAVDSFYKYRAECETKDGKRVHTWMLWTSAAGGGRSGSGLTIPMAICRAIMLWDN